MRTRLPHLAVVAWAAEVTLCPEMTLWGIQLEPLFLLCLSASLLVRQPKHALWTSWALGLLKDLGSPAPLGFYALLFLLSAAAFLKMRRLLHPELPSTQMLLSFAGTFVFVWIDSLSLLLSFETLSFAPVFFHAFGGALLGAIAAPVVFRLSTTGRRRGI